MTLPSTLRVAGRNWSIVVADLSANKAVGLCDDGTGTITVDPDQDEWALRDTILHEVLHSILRAQGRPYEGKTEERYVQAFASGLLGVLRDNPTLTSYLFKDKI